MITRKSLPQRQVDTVATEKRLRAELADVIELGQAAIAEERASDALWFLNYAAALYGVITDRWALMVITLQESDL